MLRRRQSEWADSRETKKYYISDTWARWLYIHDGRGWHVYASDGTWVQDRRTLPGLTRARMKEITEAEGEALLAAGRAKVADAEPLFHLRFVPLWKSPRLYLSLLVPLVVVGIIIALNSVLGFNVWPAREETTSFWPSLAHVLVVPALWLGLFLLARRNRER